MPSEDALNKYTGTGGEDATMIDRAKRAVLTPPFFIADKLGVSLDSDLKVYGSAAAFYAGIYFLAKKAM